MPISKEKREEFRKKAERIAREVVAPRAVEIDAHREIPRDVRNAFFENGLLSVIMPEFYGGTSCDIPALCMVVEEIAKVCASSSLLVLSHAAP